MMDRKSDALIQKPRTFVMFVQVVKEYVRELNYGTIVIVVVALKHTNSALVFKVSKNVPVSALKVSVSDTKSRARSQENSKGLSLVSVSGCYVLFTSLCQTIIQELSSAAFRPTLIIP